MKKESLKAIKDVLLSKDLERVLDKHPKLNTIIKLSLDRQRIELFGSILTTI